MRRRNNVYKQQKILKKQQSSTHEKTFYKFHMFFDIRYRHKSMHQAVTKYISTTFVVPKFKIAQIKYHTNVQIHGYKEGLDHPVSQFFNRLRAHIDNWSHSICKTCWVLQHRKNISSTIQVIQKVIRITFILKKFSVHTYWIKSSLFFFSWCKWYKWLFIGLWSTHSGEHLTYAMISSKWMAPIIHLDLR